MPVNAMIQQFSKNGQIWIEWKNQSSQKPAHLIGQL